MPGAGKRQKGQVRELGDVPARRRLWSLPRLALCAAALSSMLSSADSAGAPSFALGATRRGLAFSSALPFRSMRDGLLARRAGTTPATRPQDSSHEHDYFTSEGNSALRGLVAAGHSLSPKTSLGSLPFISDTSSFANQLARVPDARRCLAMWWAALTGGS